jgi:hypothetical protein
MPGSPTNEYRDLRPGGVIKCVVENYLPLGEWLSSGSRGAALTASIVVNDPFDNGVSDCLIIELKGNPLVPDTSEAGAWHAWTGSTPPYTSLVFRERRYWRSRKNGVAL